VLVFAREATFASAEARDRFVGSFALVPYDLTHLVVLPAPAPPAIVTLLTSQFLHASALHLTVNMLFLLVFGPRVEALCGSRRFLAFYLVCGVLGGLADVSAMPGGHVPSIGASGAIAGVLGAFAVRFPTERIWNVPAVLLIGSWAAVQFVRGFGSVPYGVPSDAGGGTAYFAHIGGFLAGVLVIGLFIKSPRSRQGPRVRSRH